MAKKRTEPHYCQCDCGGLLTEKGYRYLPGHAMAAESSDLARRKKAEKLAAEIRARAEEER